ncbi:OmpA family protein [Moraxella haemolytica]|uniref:OmpA family protein n=1 Tax=Moraxella haemolytica TaxID=2904119 RepID=UPI002543AB17|nr:OmpA family protein [Moraxella sp. ZY171148]WII95541.1 OmpA family protein [Moraxella sp. ZY171148]
MNIKMKLLAVSVASSVVIAGCASTGVQVNDNAKKAGIGALAGALGGLVISKATGGEKTSRDAAIGAVVGAGVGAYMSKQEVRLKQQTAGTGIGVTRDPMTNNIHLSIPEAITFNVGRYDIKPGSYSTLNQVAATLNQYHQTNVVVNGYASIEGSRNANQILSQNRANAVANYLTNRGVSASRITAIGRGVTTQFGNGYEPNRRVELTIIAPKSLN